MKAVSQVAKDPKGIYEGAKELYKLVKKEEIFEDD